MKNNLLNKKVLITTSGWFFAPDGRQYRAIYGTLKSITDAKDLIGFTPSRSHANWVFQVGTASIMGCQVMYVLECDKPPTFQPITERTFSSEHNCSVSNTRDNHIYNADTK